MRLLGNLRGAIGLKSSLILRRAHYRKLAYAVVVALFLLAFLRWGTGGLRLGPSREGSPQEKLRRLRDVLLLQLRKATPLHERFGKFNTCAVVGESTSLYTGPRLYGAEIDGHDAVFRLPVAEGMPWYRDRHAAFKGQNTALEVHYTGNKTWQGVPGIHKLCGAHLNVSVLVLRTDEELGLIEEATANCAPGVANDLLYVGEEAQGVMHRLHDALIEQVPWEGSKLMFTEEWLATYIAMSMCETVQLFGVITETEAYVYGEEGEKEIDSAHPMHWANALRMLGVRDTAYNMLMLSTRLEKVHRPLPEAYVVPFKRRMELTKTLIRQRITTLYEADPYRHKSCVVVGAAPTMRGSGLGEWIDSHDLVWRCNQHVANRSDPDQVRDIGSRTDVLVSLSVNIINDQVAGIMRQAYDEQGTRSLLYPPPRRNDPPVTPLHDLLIGREYDYVPMVFLQAIYDWLGKLAPSTQHNKGWFFHSTGHFAVHMAIFMCDEVAVTGFGLGRLTLFHHGFVLEAMLLELYAQAGIIKLEMPEEIRHRLRAYMHNMHKSGVLRRV